MKRIVLLCNGGLSTGILVKKMKAAAEAQDFACEISAAPVSDAEAVGAEADLILLGPQVKYRYGEIVEKYGDKGIPIQVIDQTRSESMAALAAARNSRFDEAGEHLAAAGEKMKEAHHVHTRLITMDASGELDKIGLIMIHSEDIMMGAEITLALAKEMVEMYKTH